MKILSLFDGISCGYEALLRAGIPIDAYYASEIDKYAIQIAKKNHPDIIEVGDVTKLTYHDGSLFGSDGPDDVRSVDGPFDLIMGGSPCQGFSFAGKQLAFDDPRSKLFFEFVRILREIKPKYFLLENVKMKKEFQNIISNELWTEPIEIDSSLLSAQVRKRLYWTNIHGVIQPEDKGILLKDILEPDVDLNIHVVGNQYNHRIFTDKSGTLGTCMGRTNKQGMGIYLGSVCPENFVRKLTPVECERLQTLSDNYTEGISNVQRYKTIGNGWTVDVIAFILQHIK